MAGQLLVPHGVPVHSVLGRAPVPVFRGRGVIRFKEQLGESEYSEKEQSG